MICKTLKGTRFYGVLIFVGVVLSVFGIISESMLRESAHNMSRLMGTFTGMGGGLIGVGGARLIHQKITSPEKLKQEQIKLKDERNVQILRVAYTISNAVASLLFASLVIIFFAIGSTIESYICIAAMLLQQGVFWIAYRYYNNKM